MYHINMNYLRTRIKKIAEIFNFEKKNRKRKRYDYLIFRMQIVADESVFYVHKFEKKILV